ncbi:Myb-like DNA-binding protein BAS1 [Paramyrothecium foliicola]|nr:Myb-like DNA-binding protein BAS1 [Paramyrothecium foliicola]
MFYRLVPYFRAMAYAPRWINASQRPQRPMKASSSDSGGNGFPGYKAWGFSVAARQFQIHQPQQTYPISCHPQTKADKMVNFHQSSEDIELRDGHILVAKCADENGDFVESELDLNYYIGNNDGSFQWGGENFAGSGEEISFELEGDDLVPVLRAVLFNIEGEGIPADVNLAEAIGNDNGTLVFFTPPASTESGAANVSRRARRSWTPWEDQSLRNRVAQFGHARGSEGRWTEIAQGIPGRTAKGRWTEDEDRILLEAYSNLGPAWKQIADLIPGRKDDQCSKRYIDILGPLAKNRLSGWTPEEDRILRDSVKELGHRWSAVAARLPGRPPLTCRNRWRNLSKQTANSKSTAEQQASPDSVQPASEADAAYQTESPAISGPGDAMDTPFNFAEPVSADVAAVGNSMLGRSNVLAGTDSLDQAAPASLACDWTAALPAVASHGSSNFIPNLDSMQDETLPLAGELLNWDLESSWEDQPPAAAQHIPTGPIVGAQPSSTPTAALRTTLHDSLQSHPEPGNAATTTNPVDFRALELSAEMTSRSSQQLSNIPEETHFDAQNFTHPQQAGQRSPCSRTNRVDRKSGTSRIITTTITIITIIITTIITTIINNSYPIQHSTHIDAHFG